MLAPRWERLRLLLLKQLLLKTAREPPPMLPPSQSPWLCGRGYGGECAEVKPAAGLWLAAGLGN